MHAFLFVAAVMAVESPIVEAINAWHQEWNVKNLKKSINGEPFKVSLEVTKLTRSASDLKSREYKLFVNPIAALEDLERPAAQISYMRLKLTSRFVGELGFDVKNARVHTKSFKEPIKIAVSGRIAIGEDGSPDSGSRFNRKSRQDPLAKICAIRDQPTGGRTWAIYLKRPKVELIKGR